MMKRWLLAALLMLALVSGEARAQDSGGGGGGCGVVSPCSPGQGGTGVNNGTNTLTLTGNNTVPSWVVNPPSNSYGKGINITQTGPLSDSITGPLDYNVINVTHESTVTGTGTSQADAFRVNMQTGGANLGGGGPIIGGYFNIIEGISGVTGATDKIGAVGSCDIIVSDSSGGCYGLNSFAGVGASGAINRLVGVEADMSGTSGGAVSYRYAFSAVNEGTAVQGTTLDSAYFIGNIGGNGAAFENGFALSQSLGYAPLTTSANLFVADAAMTIANVLQFPNLTVTGDILNFPNVTLTGSGQLTATGLVISSNSITASQVTFQTPVTMNDLPATGGLSYVCQAAGGVLTAQSSC